MVPLLGVGLYHLQGPLACELTKSKLIEVVGAGLTEYVVLYGVSSCIGPDRVEVF